MKRNIILLFTALLAFNLSFAQNKFESVMNSKKLGVSYKSVKAKDKEDFYQQYYWLTRMEQLKAYPHLDGIKPKVLYSFIKEITPQLPTKTLTKENKAFRDEAELSLDQYFKNKDWTNPVMALNLNTYVDPQNEKYFSVVKPERIVTLIPKKLYSFTSENSKTQEQKIQYLWIDEDKYKIVDIIPNEKKNEVFYSELKSILPNYSFPNYVPEKAQMGDKKVKSDVNYYYITAFPVGNSNIVYKTENFEDYIFVRYTKDGGPWTDVEHRERKY
ncbi:MAG: hypothetical protein K0M63_08880 [Weeksellaceae bacterium]|nr:hypothetical protein [Weeksellaceae bacterium]